MSAKLKLSGFIMIMCALCISGQQGTLSFSPSSLQENTLSLGIDVSQSHDEINWDQVIQNEPKITFVFVKATEGAQYVDSHFEKNWTVAKQLGILRGAYHSFDVTLDARAQAELFINTVKQIEETDLPPVLDLESGKFDLLDEVAHSKFITNVFIWLEEVEKKLKVKPLIYASPDFARDYLTDIKFSRCALVVAEYDTVSAAPKMWGAWEGETWTFWQYSTGGKVKGISNPVDLDKFNGSTRELLNFVKNSRKDDDINPALEEEKVPAAGQEEQETTKYTVEPETPIGIEEKETPDFKEDIDIGKVNFPRKFIHKQKDYPKGVYLVKLILKEEEEIPYFQVYDKENQLLFEEMALVIQRKGKFGKFKYRIRKRLLGSEYFMIRITKPAQHIYAFFFIKK